MTPQKKQRPYARNAAKQDIDLMQFTPVSLEEASRYYDLWNLTPQQSLDYSLANLWGWQEHYGLEWSFCNDLCWIRQTHPCGTVYWAPVGDWEKARWSQLLEPGMDFIRIPGLLAEIWKSQLDSAVQFENDRAQWEYLYLREELATLPGNRFHKKKNRYLTYVKAYGEPVYRPLDEGMIESCLSLQDTWCQWNNCGGSPSLAAENYALNRVLSRHSAFRNLTGGALYAGNDMVAFSVGERLGENCMGVHFEKGLIEIKGVYQAINVSFARSVPESCTFVNRAQDLGEEGLRHAKESYRPVDFLKKFRASIV